MCGSILICHLWSWYLASVDVREDEEQMRRERQIAEDKFFPSSELTAEKSSFQASALKE